MNYTETLCIVSHMVEDESNRLLMSDELRGMVPELEEQVKAFEDAFVIATLVLSRDQISYNFTGKVDGFSLESSKDVKIDIRVSISTAFDVMKSVSEGSLDCKFCILMLGQTELCLEAPFRVSSPKMMDFDHQNKMCTLGIDLIKI